jgi:hypothetical protein
MEGNGTSGSYSPKEKKEGADEGGVWIAPSESEVPAPLDFPMTDSCSSANENGGTGDDEARPKIIEGEAEGVN